MHLDHYLSVSINVIDIARASVVAGVSLLSRRPEQVLTMFIGTPYVQLKVLHNSVKACGFVGTEVVDYTYLDLEGHPAHVMDACQLHVYVAPADTYDHIHYTMKLLHQAAPDADVIEFPSEPGNPSALSIAHYEVVHFLRTKHQYEHVGRNPDNGHQVYVRNKK